MLARALPLLLAAPVLVQDEPPIELRGAWIATEDLGALATRNALADAMQTLAESGINAVFPPAQDRDRLAEILFEAHRHGLEVLPWFEEGAAIVETCQAYDLDGVVAQGPLAAIRKELAALDAELAVVLPAGIDPKDGEPTFRLPKVSDAAPAKKGDSLIGLAKLLEDESALARSLREERFAEAARLPWRKAAARRRAVDPIEPFAGGGLWTWRTREGEPRFLAMDGGDVGHASWNYEPLETGNHVLYAWIPSREDLADRASYKIASAGGMRTIGIDTTNPKNRGWVYVGEARLSTGKPLEVARLDAEEQDATKITAAGPLIVLRSHRPKPR